MKFLSEEWTAEHKRLLEEEFTKESRSSTELTEVYENCYGIPGKTIWIYYSMINGLSNDLQRGEGEDNIPESTFRTFGDYQDYVAVVKGELDSKKGIMMGKFTLEGNLVKAMGMLGTYSRVNQCKQIPGTEY